MIIIIFIRVDNAHERPSVFIKGHTKESLCLDLPWTIVMVFELKIFKLIYLT